MKFIAYPIEDNKVAIAMPATVGQSMEKLAETVFKDKEHIIFEDGEFDINFEFQDAYEYQKNEETGNVNIHLNYEKAKELQRNKWRALRKPLLEKLDVEFMKALESGNNTVVQSIAQQKQNLRDVTKTPMIDNLDAIKETMPNILRTT